MDTPRPMVPQEQNQTADVNRLAPGGVPIEDQYDNGPAVNLAQAFEAAADGGKRKRRTKRRKSLKKKRKTKRKTNKRKSLKKRRKTKKRKGG